MLSLRLKNLLILFCPIMNRKRFRGFRLKKKRRRNRNK